MDIQILVTLGPASLRSDIVQQMTEIGVSLFRINLSHTLLEDVGPVIRKIQSCLVV